MGNNSTDGAKFYDLNTKIGFVVFNGKTMKEVVEIQHL